MAAGAFIAGLLAGISFIVACGNTKDGSTKVGPAAAVAQLDCSTYEIMMVDVNPADDTAPNVAYTIPAGWVPFGVSSVNNVFAARCAP